MSIKRHVARAATIAATMAATVGLAACSTAINGADMFNTAATTGPEVNEIVTVGFVGFGTDDAWRAANEADIQNSFTTDAGFDLKYAPATSLGQKSQVEAFNAFVDQGVGAILLSVTDPSGWAEALQRAKDADIPVVLIGGGIEPDNTSLYATRITPGDADIAKNVADWALAALPDGGNYFVLEGSSGDASVDTRNQGWDGVMTAHPEFVKIGAESGGGSAEQAQTVTAAMLATHENNVQLIVAQSDEMALGAVQAVTAAGLAPGVNVKIASMGGSKSALEALLAGQVSFVAEYNPLLGRTAVEVVNTLLAGNTVDPIVVVPSATFSTVTQEQIDARLY